MARGDIKDPKHKLINVRNTSEGWSGLCSCGKWMGALYDNKKTLKKHHQGHVNEASNL